MIGVNDTQKRRIQAFTTLQHYITTLTVTCVFIGGIFLWVAASQFDFHHRINIQRYSSRKFGIPLQIKETHLFHLQEDIATERNLSSNSFPNKDRLLFATTSHTPEGSISYYNLLY